MSNKMDENNLLEEVVATIKFAITRKAFLSEIAFAFATLDTFGMPRSV